MDAEATAVPATVAPAQAPSFKAPAKVRGGSDSTQQGRYIPYGGGSAGWFENSGVLKSEHRNNYRFRQEMDLPEVRAKQFLRWGEAADRRSGSPRTQRKLPINLIQNGASRQVLTQDMTDRGVRLQFMDEANLSEGENCTVELLNPDDNAVLASLDAQVIWVEEERLKRSVWHVGLFFPHPSTEDKAALGKLLERKQRPTPTP
jgi:hypothetical protein